MMKDNQKLSFEGGHQHSLGIIDEEQMQAAIETQRFITSEQFQFQFFDNEFNEFFFKLGHKYWSKGDANFLEPDLEWLV